MILSKDQRQINLSLLLAEKYRKSVKSHHIEYLNQKLQLNLPIDFKTLASYDSTFNKTLTVNLTQEGEYFLKTVVLVFLVRQKFFELGETLSANLIQSVKGNIALSNILGLCYFYRSSCFESKGNLNQIRQELMDAYRQAVIDQ